VREKEDHKEDNRERDGAHDNLGDGSLNIDKKTERNLSTPLSFEVCCVQILLESMSTSL